MSDSTPTTSDAPLTFYDIAMAPPVTQSSCSPNPWKTRLALNFKRLPFTTSWTPLPSVAQVRTTLNLPACRKFADGTDFMTLPILADHSTNSLIGDSFDIAVYLHHTYPTHGGNLFPEDLTLDYDLDEAYSFLVPLSEERKEYPLFARFNTNVDASFTAHVQLTTRLFPFDPATAEVSKAEFVRRAPFASSWEDFMLEGEAREKVWTSFKAMLEKLEKVYQGGRWIGGRDTPSYADFIVGGWVRMFRACLSREEWEEMASWQGGRWGRVSEALEEFSDMK